MPCVVSCGQRRRPVVGLCTTPGRRPRWTRRSSDHVPPSVAVAACPVVFGTARLRGAHPGPTRHAALSVCRGRIRLCAQWLWRVWSSGDAVASGCGVSGRRCRDRCQCGRTSRHDGRGTNTSMGAVRALSSPASACRATRGLSTVESGLCLPRINDDRP